MATISTICDSIVSAPTFSARMTSVPFLLSVPPVTASPFVFSTGTGSPVIIDSSTDERPSRHGRRPARCRPAGRAAVAGLHLVERHVGLRAVLADAPRGLRRKVEQRADRRAGALARPQFQHLAEEDQRDDDGRRLEIDRHRAAMAAELMRKDVREQRRDDAVEIGRADADRDQRPHVRAAVDDRIHSRDGRTASPPTARPASPAPARSRRRSVRRSSRATAGRASAPW